uniref:Uncharacterized protein n=1 Tax=Cacopsylla melanoneura TaxID=428564 RepID=A0A8D9EHY9_9HEMI
MLFILELIVTFQVLINNISTNIKNDFLLDVWLGGVKKRVDQGLAVGLKTGIRTDNPNQPSKLALLKGFTMINKNTKHKSSRWLTAVQDGRANLALLETWVYGLQNYVSYN